MRRDHRAAPKIMVILDSRLNDRETTARRKSRVLRAEMPVTMVAGGKQSDRDDRMSGESRESEAVIAGKYRLVRRIGSGASARVYLARHERIRTRHFAIKILRSEFAGDSSRVSRFLHEAETCAGLRSPYTIDVVDFGETEFGVPFFVMEFANGPDLAAVIGLEGTLRPGDIARFSLNILTALEEAHAAGVVHRDLKPSNVFIVNIPGERHPIAKVADFGIAKSMVADGDPAAIPGGPGDTGHGTVLCTPNYASPELLRGRVTPQCDIYALGHMMIEMLDGNVAYHGAHPHQVTAQHLDAAPVSLSAAVKSSGMADVIERAVAKNPEKRFATAGEMKRALIDAIATITPDINADEALTVASAAQSNTETEVDVAGSTGLLLLGRMRRARAPDTNRIREALPWGDRATAELAEAEEQTRSTLRVRRAPRDAEEAVTPNNDPIEPVAEPTATAIRRQNALSPLLVFAAIALIAGIALLAVGTVRQHERARQQAHTEQDTPSRLAAGGADEANIHEPARDVDSAVAPTEANNTTVQSQTQPDPGVVEALPEARHGVENASRIALDRADADAADLAADNTDNPAQGVRPEADESGRELQNSAQYEARSRSGAATREQAAHEERGRAASARRGERNSPRGSVRGGPAPEPETTAPAASTTRNVFLDD